jgi:hypothetical protein
MCFFKIKLADNASKVGIPHQKSKIFRDGNLIIDYSSILAKLALRGRIHGVTAKDQRLRIGPKPLILGGKT